MAARLMAVAAVCTVASGRHPGSSITGDSSLATAGSPSHPAVSDATVIPIWLADR